jgi:hypothetical protein
MSNHTNPNLEHDRKSTYVYPSLHAPSARFTPKSTDTRQDSTTVKDPKKTKDNESRVDRVADKAAHKPAAGQQAYEKQKPTISH